MTGSLLYQLSPMYEDECLSGIGLRGWDSLDEVGKDDLYMSEAALEPWFLTYCLSTTCR
jgi:hypothetical protein